MKPNITDIIWRPKDVEKTTKDHKWKNDIYPNSSDSWSKCQRFKFLQLCFTNWSPPSAGGLSPRGMLGNPLGQWSALIQKTKPHFNRPSYDPRIRRSLAPHSCSSDLDGEGGRKGEWVTDPFLLLLFVTWAPTERTHRVLVNNMQRARDKI